MKAWKNTPSWLKGILICVGIWIILMVFMGLMAAISKGGKCRFFDSPTTSFSQCFAGAAILSYYAIIPVIILGAIVGLISARIFRALFSMLE